MAITENHKFFVSVILIFFLFASMQAIELTTSKGMKLYIQPDKNALYFHSEVLIRFSERFNPAISYLTLLNMFNEKVTGSKSSVLNVLFKMGNDFEVTYGIDHIIIKVNFLQSRVSQFIQFLKKILGFGNFPLKNFNYSLKNFRDLFFSDKNWGKILASQIARNEIFSNIKMVSEFIVKEKSLKNINLSQIRSFYKNNFIIPNVTVVLKGNINPYIFLGLIEKSFKNYKKYPPDRSKVPRNRLSSGRKMILINTGNLKNSPEIFWFIPVPPKNSHGFNFIEIANNILFGYPLGTISRSVSKSGVRNFRISTSVCNFQNISFICNHIKLSRYSDIQRFIFVANNSFRKMIPGRIGKKEYLASYNMIYLGEKISSDQFDYSARRLIENILVEQNPFKNRNSKGVLSNIDVSFVSFTNYIERNSATDMFLKRMRQGVIIIFGDSTRILRNLKINKSDIVNIR